VFKSAVLIFCGALFLVAGCATVPQEPLPTDWAGNNRPVPVPEKPSVRNPPPMTPTNVPPPRPAPPPVTNRAPSPVAPVFTWTSLNRWAAEQKISPPRLLSKSPLTTYALQSPRGTLVLALGSREISWNGVVLHLGFAPEFIDDQLFVHGLDLQKNLMPLLLGPPLAVGANRVVVLDPGHGGVNGGTVSVVDRRPEKEFTLDWARRMKPLLEANGWKVFLTRTQDFDLALSNRVTFAEAHHADLFISLHFNSVAPDQRPAGLATFCLTPAGMPSTVTRGYPDILTQSFPNNGFDVANLQFAERLHRALLRASGMEDRGVNRARFMGVLRGQNRPAVLLEAGFLSNPHEAKRIADPQFRQQLAEAVADVLK